MTNEIIITYVYHSCYTVEIGDYFIIFDYYKGILNIPDDKKVIFISSHGHDDHYTSDILNVPNMEDKTYILSTDIGKLHTNENVIYIKDEKLSMDMLKSLYSSDNVHFVAPNKTYHVNIANGKVLNIKTFSSTDQGISILLFVEGISIFHAGDLNYWAWPDNDEATDKEEYDLYMAEIDKIKREYIDIAFVPVDPRLEENYYKGADIFAEECRPQVLFPLHFGDHPEITQKFYKAYRYESTSIRPIFESNQKTVIEIESR